MDQNQLLRWLEINAGAGVFLLLILLVAFLVLREFWCWYWKINQMVSLLREVRGLLADKSPGKGTALAPVKESETVGPGI